MKNIIIAISLLVIGVSSIGLINQPNEIEIKQETKPPQELPKNIDCIVEIPNLEPVKE